MSPALDNMKVVTELMAGLCSCGRIMTWEVDLCPWPLAAGMREEALQEVLSDRFSSKFLSLWMHLKLIQVCIQLSQWPQCGIFYFAFINSWNQDRYSTVTLWPMFYVLDIVFPLYIVAVCTCIICINLVEFGCCCITLWYLTDIGGLFIQLLCCLYSHYNMFTYFSCTEQPSF